MGILANENSISAGGYTIERSLRFQQASSQYLTRTPASASNRKTWTWSGWVKRGNLATGAGQILFSTGPTGAGQTWNQYYFETDNRLTVINFIGGSASFGRQSDAVYRDPSAWYHVVIAFDTTQATDTNRIKFYVNGTQITTFTAAGGYSAWPSLNYDGPVNNTVAHGVGGIASNSYLDGYMAEINFIDGQALTPSSFGETDALTGVWVAKRYTGTYGTNGFYLPFNDGTSTTTLGQDRSGNANNWTLTNFTRSAGVSDCWMYDVPSGNGSQSATQPSSNYAVLNPLKSLGGQWTYSRANLQVSYASNNNIWALSSIRIPTSGKWYWEITATAISSSLGFIGVLPDASADSNTVSHVGYYRSSGTIANLAGTLQTSGASYTNNDVIGIAVDVDAGTVQFYKNNTAQGASPSFTFTANQSLTPFVGGDNTAGTKTFDVNFGQRSFAYTPPSGFKALCTANLPAPTITKANQYMDATLWSGNSASPRAISNQASFSPDLVWIKNRSSASAYWNQLTDSVRGAGKALFSNSTNAEDTNTAFGYLSAFNSDGFSVSAGTSGIPNVNETGSTYVAWQWDAGSSTVTNTSGTISSQVRANTTTGFSIVTYTGNGVASTVGHGLGVAPKMVITKNRTGADNWCVYHASLSSVTNILLLNTTNAQFASTQYTAAPTSTILNLGSGTATNNSGFNFVAYCFAEIAGFSRFGSYTGNGSADGAFVYTGFRPKFVMIKNASQAFNWVSYDTSRNTSNLTNLILCPNLAGAESTGTTDVVDMLSNGFKLRGTGAATNNSGNTFIYMAFAENPFNYSNAR